MYHHASTNLESINIFIRNRVQKDKEVKKKKQYQTSKHNECSKYNTQHFHWMITEADRIFIHYVILKSTVQGKQTV